MPSTTHSPVAWCLCTDIKSANVRPLLQKAGLDADNLKNHRPFYNLTFIFKVLAKIVGSRLERHLSTNKLHSGDSLLPDVSFN